MFLPCTRAEMATLGWDQCDIIIVTGDAYIDSPFIGAAVIGRVLENAGYRVGIIPQPDIDSARDINRLGEPKLFWGVTGGSVDSMVANYTASGKRRKRDDYTPGVDNIKRPDRAVITYTNLIKRNFKQTRPIVLGGVEASLRRIAHYDAWSRNIRRSILFDAKADYIIYGMGEKSIIELARSLSEGGDGHDVRGVCYISKDIKPGFLELPSYDQVKDDKHAFITMFRTFYENNDPVHAQGMVQKQDTRFLVHNPPAPYMSQQELDRVYALHFERDAHPIHQKHGEVRALSTIRFSVASHRGCYGECNFCSIAVHQGRLVRWRSEASIVREVEAFTAHPKFRGIVQDVGGPTANMYGFECSRKKEHGACRDKRCLYPHVCTGLEPTHRPYAALLRRVAAVKGVKRVFVASGIRPDLIDADIRHGNSFLKQVVYKHTSGQIKIAPEHTEKEVLDAMGKPGPGTVIRFKDRFYGLTRKAGKKQFVTYYFIAAHPASTVEHMRRLRGFASKKLRVTPEQVQIFTPLPSTWSGVMYATGINPFTNEEIYVERDSRKRQMQKEAVTGPPDTRQVKTRPVRDSRKRKQRSRRT